MVHAIDSRAGEGEIPKMFEAQKIVTESQMSDTEPQYFSYNARLWFCLSIIVFMPWIFPLGVIKHLTLKNNFTGFHS